MARTEDSFDAWVRPHLPAMQRYAARLTSVREAEEVVQEALVRAWRRWATYDVSRGDPAAWLLAIVRDRALRAWRVRRVRPTTVPLLGHDRAIAAEGTDVDLERALAGLSARQREAVDLYYFVDLDVASVAALMGCAPGTVRATLHQARAALRELLEDEHA
jgi:RNA polymerase sigma-70 factor (ECF subfamily)